MLKVGIVGGTGYTGVELLRLLSTHAEAEVVMITSRAEDGVAVDELFPSLRGAMDLRFSTPDVKLLATCDVVFFATPHNVAMNMVPELLAAGTRVIDLSADFRITNADLWSKWYHEKHVCPDVLATAVYGLPERNAEKIRSAKLIACPGCYPTAVQLGLIPLLEEKLVDPSRLIVSAASGVSGAGRQAKIDNLFTELSESFKAYGVGGHRHLPEIEQELALAAKGPVGLTFTPHLLPQVRGIHATMYAEMIDPAVPLDEIQFLFEKRYADAPFVDVMPLGSTPQTRTVRGSNMCRIALYRPQNRDTLVVLSAIDNLVKGASGQAIQNMNLMFGLPETMGLQGLALLP
ncbi:MAG: N-acetyl-gamma-glutamyl-phosphate reductase [Zhongshania aliphaticivorans]|uniref:N-acetyl-gamma-glutamyl-phosphate reductase n=1 Tax=Zhongshania aliphaticivorans TaxID=1470434 RepID=A0A127M1Q1_9GAMM|nr:N-acetyl-gamma-glutamyl-phosphate reductase [Zhongshania aliphaticivorans]AMO67151.1 N-acetyl-gamma-glutamyl-phosphate reductase [Zhongshania aliphaticivorans]